MTFFDQDDAVAESTQPDPGGSPLEWEDQGFVTIRSGQFRIFRAVVTVVLISTLAFVGYKGARGWFERQLDPIGEPGEEVVIIVPSGATTGGIARLLEENDVIPNSTFFRYYTDYKDTGEFQAGEYTFQLNSSAGEAVEVLQGGPKPESYRRFTIREGLWTTEILDSLARQFPQIGRTAFERVLANDQLAPRYRPEDQTSWEGLLFPETYEVNEEATALDIIQKMTDQFSQVTGELAYGAADTQLGYSAYEVLIIASLVEAEAKLDDERPLVASVIYNRLREQIPLGIDATCIYGTGDRRVELTVSILESEDPYGCRNIVGLPPTPINSPGRASLLAAIDPPETEYIYYVLTDASGSHTFATTDEEFIEAKQICQDKGLCG